MNTPVSFEIAKLLKEKGFNNKCIYYFVYTHYGNHIPVDKKDIDAPIHSIPLQINNWNSSSLGGEGTVYTAAPTIAEVVMWTFEKHGIWISVFTMDKWLPNGNDREQLFDYGIKQMKLGLINIPKKFEEFNSPTEAYAAAIEYTLKNLI